MKLKDLMANTLPRAKKSKKKHTPLNNALNNFSTPSSSSVSSSSSSSSLSTQSKKDNVNRNSGYQIQWSHSGSFDNRGFVSEWQQHQQQQQQFQQPQQQHGYPYEFSPQPDHFYPDKRCPIDAVNFNITTPERGRKCDSNRKCGCTGSSSPESWNADGYGLGHASSGDGNFNTLPRCRTRIRTNPWLPSPRASPTPSATSSPLTSPSVLPDNRWMFPGSQDQGNGNESATEGGSGIDRRPRRDSVDSSLASTSSLSTDPDSLLHTSFSSDVSTDNSITANLGVGVGIGGGFGRGGSGREEGRGGRAGAGERFGKGEREGRGEGARDWPPHSTKSTANKMERNISDLRSPRGFSPDPWTTDSTSNSDDYDDGFNDTRRKERKSRKLRDSYLKSPDYFQPIEEEDQQNHQSFAENISRGRYDSELFQEDTSNDSDGTLRGDESDMFLFEDTKLFDDDDDADKDATKYDLREIITSPRKEHNGLHRLPKTPTKISQTADLDITSDSLDSAYDTCSFSEKASPQDPPDRKLGDIRSSLQEKVLRLREEKYVVDEKIRQAQEEERIRQQEKMKFQKQITMLRKQILLRTLADLKRKLENQSERLQTTYNSVMGMQWERARSRKRFASITPNLPRKNVIEHKESPF